MRAIFSGNLLRRGQLYIGLMHFVGWLFLLGAFIGLVVYVQGRFQGRIRGNLEEVMPVATMLALSGVFLGEATKAAEKQAQNSKFLLEQSLSGIKYGVELLSDGNNDRRTWIAAARALQQSLAVANGITEREHKDIYEIEVDRYRHQLWEILNPNDEKITPAFFYGANDPHLSIDEAAKQSSIPRVGEHSSMLSSVHELSEKSLLVVWNFMKFPENYEDPLCETFLEEQLEGLRLSHRPMYDYLTHKQQYVSISRKLHRVPEAQE